MREVVADTNFLLLPFQFKIDIFGELLHVLDEPFTLVVSSKVVGELRHISRKVGKQGAAARFALKLLEARGQQVRPVESPLAVDDWVLEYAKANHAIVCTNDRGLKQRLKAERIKVIGLRTKSRLGLV